MSVHATTYLCLQFFLLDSRINKKYRLDIHLESILKI